MKTARGGIRASALSHVPFGETLIGIHGTALPIISNASTDGCRFGSAVQIHGGNGFALEYPVSRVLCDARILSIFEGAAEIQAHVIARRLLEG